MDDQARALQGLGRVFAAVGDFDRGRIEFGRALALLEANPTSQKAQQASVLLELGRMDFQQGLLDGAKTLYSRALTVAEAAGDLFTQGRALYSLGLVSVVQSAFDEAVQQYTRAADAFQKIPNADGAGQAWLARASARFEQRDLPRALEDFTLSVKTFEHTKNQEGLARAYLGLAMTHEQLGAGPRALEYAARAYDLAVSSVTPDVQWQARHVTGEAWLLGGDRVKARQAFEEAIALLEAARLDTAGGEEALAPTQRAAPYVALVEWHVVNGAPADALIAAEAGKRRLLEDLLRPFRFRLTRGLSPERLADERRLVNRRVSLLKQIRREREMILAGDAPVGEPAARAELTYRGAREGAGVGANGSGRVAAGGRARPAVARLSARRGEIHFARFARRRASSNAAFIHFVVGDERTSVIVATHPRAASADGGGEDGWRRRRRSESSGRGAAGRARVHGRADAPATGGAGVALHRRHREEGGYGDGRRPRALRPAARARRRSARRTHDAGDRAGRRAVDAAVRGADARGWPLSDRGRRHHPAAIGCRLALAAGARGREPVDRHRGDRRSQRHRPVPDAPDIPARRPAAAASRHGSGRARPTPHHATAAAPTPRRPPRAAAGVATLAAWELFDRDLTTHDLVLADVTPKGERLRLDAGRLGPTGLYWALQVAGARRVIFSRRPAQRQRRPSRRPAAAPARPGSASGLPHPHDWAPGSSSARLAPPSQPSSRLRTRGYRMRPCLPSRPWDEGSAD